MKSRKHTSLIRSLLDRDGYVVVDGLFSEGEIAALGDELNRVISGVAALPGELRDQLVLERDLTQAQRGEVSEADAGDHVFIVGELQRFSPTFEALIEHEGMLAVLCSCFESREFAFHYMNATIKSPRIGSKVAWHRDWPNKYMSGKSSNQLRAMLCLDGMREGAGAICIVSGSHTITDKAARTASVQGAVWRAEEIDTIECAPGALVVLHSKVVHGSGPNRSERQRRNIILQWGGPNNSLTGGIRELHTGRTPMMSGAHQA